MLPKVRKVIRNQSRARKATRARSPSLMAGAMVVASMATRKRTAGTNSQKVMRCKWQVQVPTPWGQEIADPLGSTRRLNPCPPPVVLLPRPPRPHRGGGNNFSLPIYSPPGAPFSDLCWRHLSMPSRASKWSHMTSPKLSKWSKFGFQIRAPNWSSQIGSTELCPELGPNIWGSN